MCSEFVKHFNQPVRIIDFLRPHPLAPSPAKLERGKIDGDYSPSLRLEKGLRGEAENSGRLMETVTRSGHRQHT